MAKKEKKLQAYCGLISVTHNITDNLEKKEKNFRKITAQTSHFLHTSIQNGYSLF